MYVTDHAIVRYMERIRGVDIASIRAELQAFADMGCLNLVIQDATIVTVVAPPHRTLSRRRAKRHHARLAA